MKNCKELIVALVLMLGYANNSFGQGAQHDLDKYWHYRYRLTHYFMIIGAQQGQSLPANIRNYGGSGSGIGDQLYWADGGRALGAYICMLATEYRILKDNGQCTNETVMELYYALHAVYRLDSMAAIVFGTNATAVAKFPGTGYELRDDVDWLFASRNYNQLNLGANLPSGGRYTDNSETVGIEGSGRVGPIDIGEINAGIVSDYHGVGGTPETYGNFANGGDDQGGDNYQHILMGLALVVKLVDPSIKSFIDNNGQTQNFTNLYGVYGGTGLKEMAYAEGRQILKYIIVDNDFHLKETNGNYTPDGRGGCLLGYAGALEALGVNIFGYNFSDYPFLPPASLKCDFNGLGGLGWDGYNLCDIWCVDRQISGPELGCVAAAYSNNPGGGYSSAYSMIQSLGNYPANPTCNGCPFLHIPANQFGWDLYYGGILQLIYADAGANVFNNGYDLCSVEYILDRAPDDGPFCHTPQQPIGSTTPPDYAPDGWASDRRFIEDYNANTGGPGNPRGNYNGLDYMVLHNLYYLMSELHRKLPTKNIIDNTGYTTVDGKVFGYPNTYPFATTNPSGLVSSPWIISSCNEIVVNDLDIQSNVTLGSQSGLYGGLTLKGGYLGIDMIPSPGPIKVENGTYFHAYCPNSCCQAQYSIYVSELNSNDGYINSNKPIKPTDSANSLPVYKPSSEFSQHPTNNAMMNYPNPFHAQTTIEFAIKENCNVTISIYDINGNKIDEVVTNRTYDQGMYAANYDGSKLAAGTYLCVMTTKDDKKTIRIIKG